MLYTRLSLHFLMDIILQTTNLALLYKRKLCSEYNTKRSSWQLKLNEKLISLYSVSVFILLS